MIVEYCVTIGCEFLTQGINMVNIKVIGTFRSLSEKVCNLKEGDLIVIEGELRTKRTENYVVAYKVRLFNKEIDTITF